MKRKVYFIGSFLALAIGGIVMANAHTVSAKVDDEATSIELKIVNENEAILLAGGCVVYDPGAVTTYTPTPSGVGTATTCFTGSGNCYTRYYTNEQIAMICNYQ